jgi:hypothetical protein
MTEAVFGYKLQSVQDGWRWLTFAEDGSVAETGVAPTRAVAAACIIRALTEGCIRQAA